MPRQTVTERIATLEAKQAQIHEDVRVIKTSVGNMEEAMSRQKGFIGGVIFVVSCIWAAIIGGFTLWHKSGV